MNVVPSMNLVYTLEHSPAMPFVLIPIATSLLEIKERRHPYPLNSHPFLSSVDVSCDVDGGLGQLLALSW